MRVYSADKSDANREIVTKFDSARATWMSDKARGPFGNLENYVFEDVMSLATPPVGWLNEQEQATAKGFAKQSPLICSRRCEEEGRLARRARLSLLISTAIFGGIDAKMKELFGVSLNDVR